MKISLFLCSILWGRLDHCLYSLLLLPVRGRDIGDKRIKVGEGREDDELLACRHTVHTLQKEKRP